MSKLLTIVIPTYNTEKYLPKCIESLIIPDKMNQIEILIVIDGSPDNSFDLAKIYEKKFPNSIKVIEKVNGGHGSTINKGLELASGKYFRVLDSDDWFNTINFSKYLDKLSDANEDVILTHISKEYVYQNKSEVEQCDSIEFDKIYDANVFKFEVLHERFFGMARCTYKTESLKNHELLLLEKIFFEDSFLHVFPLIFLKTFVFYDLVIYHYFIGRPGQSISPDVALKHNKYWHRIIEQIGQFYNKNSHLLNDEKEKFLIKILKNYISTQYVVLNKFDFKRSKIQLKLWDNYVSSLTFLPLINCKRRRLYRLIPYVIYRNLFKLRGSFQDNKHF
jgi:glycosyltransferase involved in cell wall biosynthesis